eukprot:4806069-Prymnesium_polylepis.1
MTGGWLARSLNSLLRLKRTLQSAPNHCVELHVPRTQKRDGTPTHASGFSTIPLSPAPPPALATSLVTCSQMYNPAPLRRAQCTVCAVPERGTATEGPLFCNAQSSSTIATPAAFIAAVSNLSKCGVPRPVAASQPGAAS